MNGTTRGKLARGIRIASWNSPLTSQIPFMLLRENWEIASALKSYWRRLSEPQLCFAITLGRSRESFKSNRPWRAKDSTARDLLELGTQVRLWYWKNSNLQRVFLILEAWTSVSPRRLSTVRRGLWVLSGFDPVTGLTAPATRSRDRASERVRFLADRLVHGETLLLPQDA